MTFAAVSYEDLPEIARNVVRQALDAGASDAECTISEGDEFSANVRMGELETLKEAGSRGAGLRVLIGKRMGASYTSDLTPEGIQQMVRSAIDLAALTTEDPHAGLPEAEEMGSLSGDLQLFSNETAKLPTEERIAIAKRAEAAALAVDARISNSEGASFDSSVSGRVFANSRGFSGAYRSSYCSVSAVPVATQNGSMERDYWFTIARNYHGLEDAETVGRKAAERALRRLGAVKVETQRVPVVFEPRTARTLLGNIFDAIDGRAIYRNASFLAGKLGEKIADERITLVDDGTIPGLFGSSPFDDEGVPTRRTAVIERGVLKSYLLNTYTARKLNMKTTGNASRGITGNAGIGHGNFFIEAGTRTPEEIMRGIKNGFLVTELIGSGVNTVTGDYSRGAVGIWIRDGEPAFPVSEVTIASTLQEMLNGIGEIGSDLEFLGSVSAPTIMIGEMTVAGR
ncbi:MAG TPA: metallopeptidase TldD-related protein [Bryobacteraceae bacterium]|nr:metallopeptidase TldD-related protein [Bryobacteraceae bacterium]